jgi:hypothetical protein
MQLLCAGNAVQVSKDTLLRIGYIAGIFKALEILYAESGLAGCLDQAAQIAPSAARRPCSACGSATSQILQQCGAVSTQRAHPGVELEHLSCGLAVGLARWGRGCIDR